MKKKQLVAKMLLAMKISFIQLSITLLSLTFVYANESDGQNILTKKISISVKNGEIRKVIELVQSQTDLRFIYSPNSIDDSKIVSYTCQAKTLKDFFEEFLSSVGITYKIVNEKKVLLYLEKKIEIDSLTIGSTSNLPPPIVVNGTVKDDKGNSMEGVSVKVKNALVSTVTDKEGKFSIKVTDIKNVLVFSFVGYTVVERGIGANKTIDIILKEETSDLNDVIVVGYGTQKRKDLTGAIAKVNMEDLNKAPVRSFDEALAGRVAGVQVSSQDGQPGSQVNIVIRGNNSVTQDNSPLYVIDGFPIEGYNNNLLSPNEIESIEILKDASATAIYGARGANGVIMITTKKGKEGPPVVTYDAYYGVQNRIKKIALLSPYDFANLQIETLGIPAFTALYLTPSNRKLEDYKNLESFDWQDMLNRTAPMYNNFISVAGGTRQTKYSMSGSITGQDGIIKASSYTRYQGRVSLDQTVNDKFKTGVNISYSSVLQKGTPPSSTYSAATSNLLYQAWGFRPITGRDYDDFADNLYDPDIPSSSNYIVNPVATAENELRNNTTNNIVINAYADYQINTKLKFRTTAGINNIFLSREAFNNSNTNSGGPNSVFKQGVNGAISTLSTNNWLNENTLTYTNRFNKVHDLSIVAGITAAGTKIRSYAFSANQIPNESLGINGLREGVPLTNQIASSESVLASYLARVNYNYKSKYLVTLTYRVDGSSRFAKENKYSYFPSGSIAWRFSNEEFMKKIKFVSDAKIRLGFGFTGNNRVSDFAYLPQLSSPIASVYPFDNNPTTNIGANRTTVGNPDLKWETTEQTNAGLDISFLKNRMSLTVDVYKKITKDLLLNAQLPGSSGFTTAFKNIGKVRNQGLEITLNTTNIDGKKFKWYSSFNISFNESKVLQLSQNQDALPVSVRWDQNYSSLTPYLAKIDQPMSSFYGLIDEGLYQYDDFNIQTGNSGVRYALKDEITSNGNIRANIQPGDIRYADLNGDKTIDARDYTIIGRGLPLYTGGFSNNFRYKNFDLNIFFQWSVGNDIINANRYVFESGYRQHLNQYATYANRWSPTNQTSDIPRYSVPGNYQYSSRVIEDGSYLRLKTVALGYNLPENVLKALKFKNIRLSLSAQNLFTWTNYSGLDPEVSVRNSALTQGFDFSAYPRARVISLNVNVRF